MQKKFRPNFCTAQILSRPNLENLAQNISAQILEILEIGGHGG